MAAETATRYPLRYDIDYPEQLSRVTSAFRLIMIIPIAIVIGAVGGAMASSGSNVDNQTAGFFIFGGGGALFWGPLLMILLRQKYPRWWFEWNVELLRFSARVGAYAALLSDEYPSTDEEQAVHIAVDYPDAERELTRWLPLVKWFLAIPHYIVLFFLFIAAFVVIVIAWFAILFTGRYPRDLFNFVVGVGRWTSRVQVYALLLVTDRYPPFRLSE